MVYSVTKCSARKKGARPEGLKGLYDVELEVQARAKGAKSHSIDALGNAVAAKSDQAVTTQQPPSQSAGRQRGPSSRPARPEQKVTKAVTTQPPGKSAGSPGSPSSFQPRPEQKVTRAVTTQHPPSKSAGSQGGPRSSQQRSDCGAQKGCHQPQDTKELRRSVPDVPDVAQP